MIAGESNECNKRSYYSYCQARHKTECFWLQKWRIYSEDFIANPAFCIQFAIALELIKSSSKLLRQ